MIFHPHFFSYFLSIGLLANYLSAPILKAQNFDSPDDGLSSFIKKKKKIQHKAEEKINLTEEKPVIDAPPTTDKNPTSTTLESGEKTKKAEKEFSKSSAPSNNTPETHTQTTKKIIPENNQTETGELPNSLNKTSIKKVQPKEGLNENYCKNFINKWKQSYASKKTPLQEWNKTWMMPAGNWFLKDSNEIPEKWFFYLAPLGLRVVGHENAWPNWESTRNLFPELLKDDNGDMVTSALEVRNVALGSPADGFIQNGDLIFEIDGERLKDATSIKHKMGKLKLQSTRGLQMHSGLLLDKAEGRGTITMKLFRPSEIKTHIQLKSDPWKKLVETSLKTPEAKNEGVPLNIPLTENTLYKINITDGGNGNGSDGCELEEMYLVSGSKKIPLHEGEIIAYTVGYGSNTINEKISKWPAHAPAQVTFKAPKGKWTLVGKVKAAPPSSTDLIVSSKKETTIPKELLKQAKTVKFPIQKIGSFGDDEYDSSLPKAKIMIDTLASWLVAQQNSDGSWDRPAGYTKSHYDTASVGLALMSTGEKQYDESIKKAAEYCAFSGTKDWWGVPLSTETTFLCEYYLRYKDPRMILPIRNNANRLINEMLYGDWVSGHGKHPGYVGSGVSTGGSTMALALALASKTPAQFDKSVVDKMLIRAQQIAPSGYVPYGRTAENLSLDPSLQWGGSYSGRCGGYLIASYVHGGPMNFTKNLTANYEIGDLGSMDQGHSTESLSLFWGLAAASTIGDKVIHRHLSSFDWKMTNMRAFDGSFVFNHNPNELQTAEGVIGVYIRSAGWLLGMCGDRHAIAMTGNKSYKAKKFMNVPTVPDPEVRVLDMYKRNYTLALTFLGDKCPAKLKSLYSNLQKIAPIPGCRSKLVSLLKPEATKVAAEILQIKGISEKEKAYCAEIILGIDTRITFDPKQQDNKPVQGDYDLKITVASPFSGRVFRTSGPDPEKLKVNQIPFTAKVTITAPSEFGNIEPFEVNNTDKNPGDDWSCYNKNYSLSANFPLEKTLKANAHISYIVDGLNITYDRPLLINEKEVGGGEKGRKVTNDRALWIPGTLIRDHGNWGMPFTVANGIYISAASQSNEVLVHEGDKTWDSAQDGSLTANSQCLFRCATGWDGLELRISELNLIKQGAPKVALENIKVNNRKVKEENILSDRNRDTFETFDSDDGTFEITATLKSNTLIRGIDLRSSKEGENDFNAVVEVDKGGAWTPVLWTTFLKNEGSLFEFQPVRTSKVRVTLKRKNKCKFNLGEFIVYQAIPTTKTTGKSTSKESKELKSIKSPNKKR